MVRLYDAQVMHARLWPKRHGFTHAVFCFAVETTDFGTIGRGLALLGEKGWAPYQLRQADFLPAAAVHAPEGTPQGFGTTDADLAARVRAFCAAHGETLADDAQITLVAMPRAFGHGYNPAIFLLVRQAGRLHCGIAEVHNTFGERKAWFLGPACRRTDDAGVDTLVLRTPKRFYVSPFSGLDTEFEFTLRAPGERLALAVDHYEDGRKTLVSTWTGRTVPLTDARLFWLTCKVPLLILKVVALIHAHAAWLWLAKRLPFRRKGDDIGLQRSLRHPTAEILRKE
jgi:DUF1365 family protein